jgi:NADH-quinone oxidoreductase subunit H
VSGVLLAGTLSTRKIIEAQSDSGVWFVFLAPVAFFIYLVASIAETNRAPFDLPEAESELVAGYMTEYSGFRWSVYFLAEYCNMIVVASIATTLFLGGWMRPLPRTAAFNFLDFVPPLIFAVLGAYCFYRVPKQPVKVQKMVMGLFGLLCFGIAGIMALPFAPQMAGTKAVIHGVFWFLAKVVAYIYAFMWIRFTFPRYRFDQLMRLGWQFLIPVSIVNVFAMGTALLLRQRGWSDWLTFPAAIVVTLLVAVWLLRAESRRQASGTVTTEQAI